MLEGLLQHGCCCSIDVLCRLTVSRFIYYSVANSLFATIAVPVVRRSIRTYHLSDLSICLFFFIPFCLSFLISCFVNGWFVLGEFTKYNLFFSINIYEFVASSSSLRCQPPPQQQRWQRNKYNFTKSPCARAASLALVFIYIYLVVPVLHFFSSADLIWFDGNITWCRTIQISVIGSLQYEDYGIVSFVRLLPTRERKKKTTKVRRRREAERKIWCDAWHDFYTRRTTLISKCSILRCDNFLFWPN